MHQEEPRAHCTTGSEDPIPSPKGYCCLSNGGLSSITDPPPNWSDFRQHKVPYGIFRLFHLCHVLSVDLLMSPLWSLLEKFPAGGHFVWFWQFASSSSSHKGADIYSGAGLLLFYSTRASLCIFSMSLKLCWETHHTWMHHLGGDGLPGQPDRSVDPGSCCK